MKTTRVGFGELMELAPVDERTFRAPAYPDHPAERHFGGQLVAQAVSAAGRTVPAGTRPHSLHAYFLRGGLISAPLDYVVTDVKDGRSLSARRVDTVQNARTIFTLIASFEAAAAVTPGEWDAYPPITGPGPHESLTDDALAGSPLDTFPATNAFEVRFAGTSTEVPRPFHPCWVRLREKVGDDPLLAACAVAFISDMGVLSSAVPADEIGLAYGGASVDHALWFGPPTDLASWHLFEVSPLMRAGRRGLAHGVLRAEDGAVAAVISQEGYF